MAINAWMSWEGGIDLVAKTSAEIGQPNIIVHVARMVHTPVGSAPSAIVVIPDATGTPHLIGFVSSDPIVGAFFGPHIFAGTPFETVPVLQGRFDFEINAPRSAVARIEVAGAVIELQLADFSDLLPIERNVGAPPFAERAFEAAAKHASLKFNGEEIDFILPLSGLSGGAPAVWAPAGCYWR